MTRTPKSRVRSRSPRLFGLSDQPTQARAPLLEMGIWGGDARAEHGVVVHGSNVKGKPRHSAYGQKCDRFVAKNNETSRCIERRTGVRPGEGNGPVARR